MYTFPVSFIVFIIKYTIQRFHGNSYISHIKNKSGSCNFTAGRWSDCIIFYFENSAPLAWSWVRRGLIWLECDLCNTAAGPPTAFCEEAHEDASPENIQIMVHLFV